MDAQYYQAYYCEENIRRLCDHPDLIDLPQEVIFITNPRKQCAVWTMRVAEAPWQPVIWDYHVILAVTTTTGRQIWDFDTVLGMPVEAELYIGNAFMAEIDEIYQPWFRVVEGAQFCRLFASDRRHMRDAADHWLQPPPFWKPYGEGAHNLSRWIDLKDPIAGSVMDLPGLTAHFLG